MALDLANIAQPTGSAEARLYARIAALEAQVRALTSGQSANYRRVTGYIPGGTGSGPGFTYAVAGGLMVVTFATAFSSPPFVVVTAVNTSYASFLAAPQLAAVPTTTGFSVNIKSDSGGASVMIDLAGAFCFMAEGI